MHTQELRGLGIRFSNPGTPVTFNDAGSAPTDSPYRLAFSHVEETTYGALAGAAGLMRFPHVVAGLLAAAKWRPGWTLWGHIGEIYNVTVAATYGDKFTLDALRHEMTVKHNRTIREADQPQWFNEFVGPLYRGDFKTGDTRLMHAVTITLGAAIARAHMACGLVTEAAFPAYAKDFMATVGHIAGIAVPSMPMTYQDLLDAEANIGIPVMNFDQLGQTEVPGLVADLLKNQIGAQSLGEMSALFAGFMNPDARKALGLPWTTDNQTRLAAYCGDRVAIRTQRAADPNNFFIASRRDVVRN